MKMLKIASVMLALLVLSSCASSYHSINPSLLHYSSQSSSKEGVVLEYRYNLLDKKYQKKELAKGVKLVAIKLTNKSGEDIIFGKDIQLTYDDGSKPYILENEQVFKQLKQSPASYLLYLLLSPLNLYISESTSSPYEPANNKSIPIGLVVGPGLAGGNAIAAGSANKKFKQDLLDYNINGSVIKKGETISGLIGIKTDEFKSLNLKVKESL